MAATVSRRGSDDRRPSVLAPSETGRIRGEASLPAHRAGGRIPVGGAGLRARLAYVSAATTTVAALAFLIPLGWELRSDHRDTVLSAAQQRSATVAGAITAGAGKKGLDAAVASAGGNVVVHVPGTTVRARASAADLQRAVSTGAALTLDTDGGVVRLQPVKVGDKSSVV